MRSGWSTLSVIVGTVLPLACAGENLEPTDGAGGEANQAGLAGHGGSSGRGTTGAGTSGTGMSGAGSSALAGNGGNARGGRSGGTAGRIGSVTGGNSGTGGTSHAAGEGGGSGSDDGGADEGGTAGQPCVSCAGRGSAGGGGNGGRPAITQRYDFGSDEQSFAVQYTAAGALLSGDDATPVPKDDVGVQWVTGKGDGDGGGALEISVPFTSESQFVGIGLHLNAEDMSGKIVTARVKIDSGLEDSADLVTNPPGAKLYVKSGVDYTYASGAYSVLTERGRWYTLSFALDAPEYVDSSSSAFDPAVIGELGVQFDTSSTTTTAQAAVLLVDNIAW